MQVTADLYDWAWVKSAKDFDYFFNVLETSEEEQFKSESCYNIVSNWADSHNMWSTAMFILEWLEKNTNETISNLIRRGIYPLISENSFIDELNYGEASHGCFYATLSPVTVCNVAEAFNAIDLGILRAVVEKAPRELFVDERITTADNFIQYLQQWLQLLNSACAKGMGIIGHMG